MRTIRGRRKEKGQATIEFLMSFPVFFWFIFTMMTVAVMWLVFFLNTQAATEAAAAQGAYGGGAARAAQVGKFGSRLGTNVSGVQQLKVADTIGDSLIIDTTSTSRPPWAAPMFNPRPAQGRGVSMSPVWKFEPNQAP